MGKDLKGKDLGKGFSQRKNGTYVARYINRFGERKSLYNKDLRVLRKEYEKEKAKNTLKLTVINDSMTLDQWYDIWFSTYKVGGVRENTLRRYNDLYTRNISPELGKCKFDSITKIQCVALLKRLKEEGYGWETQSSVKRLLSDMYNRGIEDSFASRNPMKGVKLPSPKPENDVKALSREDQALFFECSAGTFYNNLFVVAVNTGMRPGEIFGLAPEDVNFEKKKICVNHTLVYQKYLGDTKKEFHLEDPKTKGSKRELPMNCECEIALKRQFVQKAIIAKRNVKQHEFSDRLFVTSFNTPLNSVILSDAIKKIVNEINLMLLPIDQVEPFGGHTFRHTFATRALESGVAPKTLQKYLGHASIQTTMDLYVHVLDDIKRAEIEMVGDTFSQVQNREASIEVEFESVYQNGVPVA